MRKIIYLVLLLPILAIAQSPDQNWVKTKTYKEPTTTSLVTPTPAQAVTQVNYFDGLGRSIQQVAFGQSNTGKDIITHIEYDAFGRQTKEFLPYANQNSSLYYNVNANTEVINFYNTSAYENTTNPFSEKLFEASPLNRISKQAAPGLAWKLDSGHEIKKDYQTNTNNEVKKFIVTSTFNNTTGVYDNVITESGYFLPNQLFKTIVKDEHWMSYAGNSNCTQEFKNKEGQVVLKRVYGGSTVGNAITQSNHDTYYVYDIRGNLAYVIPPLVTSATSQLEGLCYQYKYDNRNRLIEKKLPGKQWEYIVYDKLDRVVATGPAYNPYGGSDTNKGWLLTKYDVFNRPLYTAWYNAAVASSANRKTLQDIYNNATVFSESKSTSTTTINGIATKYTNQVSPSAFILLTVNYYDSYDFPNAPPIPTQVEGQNTQSTNLKGLATGTWLRVLDNASSTTNETSYTVYDTKYRPIRSYTKNYLGGYMQIDTKLDWAGKTLFTVTSHKRTDASELFTVIDRFEYSPQDRLTNHVQQLTTPTLLPKQLLTLNTYDELGQLISKNVGGTDVTGAQALQAVDYSYNIRGWLKSINDVNTIGTDLFAFKINYNKKEDDSEGLFNGNITETLWRTSADNIKRKYNYSYDDLNRLLSADYSKPGLTSIPNNYAESINYDKNGNITALTRYGDLDSDGITSANLIDDLKYTYDANNANVLVKVLDLSNSPQGFNESADVSTGDSNGINDQTNDYSYDANGNMTKDTNKSIQSITYNHLNLPIKINFGAKGEITYLYNATGQKLQKFVKDVVSNTNTTTDYLSGFQYLDTTLDFFTHAQGYVKFTLTGKYTGIFSYVFNYTDHLGNIRLSYSKDPSTNVLKILEENHYYPFGLKHTNYNSDKLMYIKEEEIVKIKPIAAPLQTYNYKYNGKELQDELGLNIYDYGARNYDPAIGRWMNIDPLAEKAHDLTPYRYCFNNPVNYNDPTGLWEGDYFSEEGKYLGNDGVDDDKVYVAKEGSYVANNKGGYNIANSGVSELKDGKGNAVDINTFKHLVSTLYAEGSSTWEEAAGIFSVLENRAIADGTSIMEQASYDKGVYGASAEGLAKYSSKEASTSLKENANKGLILGLTTSKDYSNGAYFWDGIDFLNGGGHRERYTPGYKFTDASHDLWKQGDNKVSGTVGRGTWDYKYKSTGAAGNTTFSVLTYQYRIAQFIDIKGNPRISNWKGNKPQ